MLQELMSHTPRRRQRQPSVARLTLVAAHVEAECSPFSRQPKALRAVTHSQAQDGLIAPLIDLHQRSQSWACKNGNAPP